MTVKIRLSRVGKKNNPSYRIVVKPQRSNRDGRSLEILGHYDPITKTVECNKERFAHWISLGAQASPTIARLLGTKKQNQKTSKTSSKKEEPKTKKDASKKNESGKNEVKKEMSA